MSSIMRSRLALDLVSSSLLLLAMAYHWQGNAFHEFVGTGMFALVVAHNVFNRRWWGAQARPRPVRRDALHTGLTWLLLGAMLVLLVTSAMISETVLASLAPTGSFTVRQVHGFVGYWVLAIVAVHIGLRWNVVMAAARGLFGITTPSRMRSAVLRLVAIGTVAAGLQAASALGVLPRLRFEMSLDWWNFEESVFGFFAYCLLFAGALVALAHYAAQGLQWLQRRRRARTTAAPKPPRAPSPTQPRTEP
jgi:hypothetical protein